MTQDSLLIQAHEGILSISRDDWQPLVAHESPFLDYGFLSLLEETGCVSERAGWLPLIITATRSRPGSPDKLVGALPFYIKTNSAGEFVFDWSWADAAQRSGLSYYPKGLVAVPFTPVTGRRVLLSPSLEPQEHEAIAQALIAACVELAQKQLKLSSVHFNFILPEERAHFDAVGLLSRAGIQYHWYNRTEAREGAPRCERFDDFLGRFRSKRRANVRRERRRLQEQGVTTKVLRAPALTEATMHLMFTFYRNTVEKFYWGQQYLNEEFFLRLPEVLPDPLHLVFAYDDQGAPFAGAFNMTKDDRLYGRYWGCTQEVEFAHFEVCMYTPIQWCIDHKVDVFEPGAGGEHKYERGFEPTFTYSEHAIFNPRLRGAISQFLTQERAHTAHQLEALKADSCLKI